MAVPIACGKLFVVSKIKLVSDREECPPTALVSQPDSWNVHKFPPSLLVPGTLSNTFDWVFHHCTTCLHKTHTRASSDNILPKSQKASLGFPDVYDISGLRECWIESQLKCSFVWSLSIGSLSHYPHILTCSEPGSHFGGSLSLDKSDVTIDALLICTKLEHWTAYSFWLPILQNSNLQWILSVYDCICITII